MKTMLGGPTRSIEGRGMLLLSAVVAAILACGVQPSAAQISASDSSAAAGLNMTANKEMFSGAVRQLLRFVVTRKTKAEIDDLVSKGPSTYKEILASVTTLPTSFPDASGKAVQLPSAFELVSVRRLDDTTAQVEVAVKLASEAHGALVQEFINKSPNYAQWANKTWATAQEMKPNRAVMVTQRIDAVFTPGMADKNSTAFAAFRDKYLPAFKAIIQAKVPEVTDVVLLGLSAGSVVAETAILVNGSGSNSTTNAITSTANSTTTVGNMTTQTLATNSNSTYLAPSDTVNSVAPQTAAGANTSTTVAGAISTTAPGATTVAGAISPTAPGATTVAGAISTTAPGATTVARTNTTTIAPGAATATVVTAAGSVTTTGTGTSSGTTTVKGTGTNTATGTTAGPGTNTASAGGSSGTSVSPGVTQANGLYLRPGTATTDLDVTTQTDYFTNETRLVLRYTKTVTAANMATYLNETSTNYKDEASMVTQMPKTFNPATGGAFTLTEPFSLKMSRQQSDTTVEFECSAKAAVATQVDAVIANFTNTAPYASLPNKKWSLGRDMIPNRVVPLATSLNMTFLPQYLDRSSAEFTALKNTVLPSLLQQLKAKEPRVEKLMILAVSKGSTVLETAALVNSSGSPASTAAITSAAAAIASLGGVNATNLPAAGNVQTYVTASDTVNSVSTSPAVTAAPAGTAASGSTVKPLIDDVVGGITTKAPKASIGAATPNKYFMNVTVPSFIGLMILISIFLFCTVSSNSCLCKMCSSNVKKDIV